MASASHLAAPQRLALSSCHDGTAYRSGIGSSLPTLRCAQRGQTLEKEGIEPVLINGHITPLALAGQNVGCLLRGVARDEVERGQVLAAVGSITPHRNFEAEVYELTKEEGGRHTPFFDGYTPQFFFRTADVTGSTSVLGDADMAMPGDGVKLGITPPSGDLHLAHVSLSVRDP